MSSTNPKTPISSTMAQSVDTFILPDLHALHPFKGGQNPLFEVVRKESRDWINSFEILPENLRAGFTATYGELLASYTYPYAPHAVLRVCADFVNVLFTLDEVSDDQGPEAARETINLFLRALRYEPDLDDGSPLAKMLIRYAATHWFTPYDSHWVNLSPKFCRPSQEGCSPKLPTPFL